MLLVLRSLWEIQPAPDISLPDLTSFTAHFSSEDAVTVDADFGVTSVIGTLQSDD